MDALFHIWLLIFYPYKVQLIDLDDIYSRLILKYEIVLYQNLKSILNLIIIVIKKLMTKMTLMTSIMTMMITPIMTMTMMVMMIMVTLMMLTTMMVHLHLIDVLGHLLHPNQRLDEVLVLVRVDVRQVLKSSHHKKSYHKCMQKTK